MRNYDLSPLLRSSVGFDHLSRLLDTALTTDNTNAYPPYNIEKLSDDDYRISVAVAGFRPDELSVVLENGTLTLEGRSDDEKADRRIIHRGIATRAFRRQFELAESIKVGKARFENGLLEIDLQREIPEHKRPRKIDIVSGEPTPKTIEAEAA